MMQQTSLSRIRMRSGCRIGPSGNLAGRPEHQAQSAFFGRQRLAQVSQQQRDEDVIGRDIQQRSLAGALTHGGQRVRIEAFAIEAHPFDLQRQQIAFGRAVSRRLEEGEPWPVVADVAERNRRCQLRAGSSIGERSGYQRVRARWAGRTSRSNTPRARASDTQVEPSGTTSVSNSGTARGAAGSDVLLSSSLNQ